MFMIVACHFVMGNKANGASGLWISEQPLSFTNFFYQVICRGGGWFGNIVFFTISVWFLIDKNITVKNSLKRIWILERELLFWSITLFVVTVVLHQQGIYRDGLAMLGVRSVLPLSTNLWWYPTSYALFLLFIPYLSIALKALGRKLHCTLAISVLIIWGIAPLLPKITFNLVSDTVFNFLYLFILISYYKWYMSEFSNRTCIILILVGLSTNILYWLAGSIIYSHTGKLIQMQNYLVVRCSISEMMIGFAVFILFTKFSFHSRIINVLAASAFGVYLIHIYPSMIAVWPNYLSINKVFYNTWAIPLGLLEIFIIFGVCLVLDLLRQGLFATTINRNKGKWFELMYATIQRKVAHRKSYRKPHVSSDSVPKHRAD
nr:acyltransferase [Bifidobacterium animalis]